MNRASNCKTKGMYFSETDSENVLAEKHWNFRLTQKFLSDNRFQYHFAFHSSDHNAGNFYLFIFYFFHFQYDFVEMKY